MGAAATSLAMAMLFVVSQTGASAQVPQLLPPLPPLLPTPTTAPPPPAATEPSPTTTTTIPLLLKVLQPPTTTTTPPPPLAPVPVAASAPDNGAGDGPVPAGAGVFPADLARQSRSVRRSAARNTRALAEGVRALVDLGMAPEEAARAVYGRFPVAGPANYSHDWWLPRFGPGWRLHLGTDIMAPRGTPVLSPTDGVVRLANGGLGGISVYVVQEDGTYFYMAHLNGRPPDLKDGQAVRTGDLVGFVGSSGNASGGSTHVHFEVHPAPVKVVTKGRGKNRTTTIIPLRVRPGTVLPAIDPKAYLDRALQDAVTAVPGLVAAYQANRPPPAPGPIAAFPGALVAGGLPTELASVVRLGPAGPAVARVPLLLLAFLLLVVVAVLTPVLAPRRAGRAGALDGTARQRRHKSEAAEAGEVLVAAAADSPEPAETEPAETEPAESKRRRRRGLRRRAPSPSP